MTNLTETQPIVLAFFNFTGWELAILLVLGLLIFGRRLPELGKSVGRTIVEFKKGLSGIDSDVNNQTAQTPANSQASQGHSAALPSTPASTSASQQSAESSTSAAQGQYRPPQG